MEMPKMTDKEALEELAKLHQLQKQLAEIKSTEALMRRRLFTHFFPTADEGTNTRLDVLPNGWQLKGERSIDRKVDEGTLNVFRQPGQDGKPSILDAAGVNVDRLIRWKPELSVKEYRELTEDQVKIVDQILIIKDGMPGLKMVPPSARSESERRKQEMAKK